MPSITPTTLDQPNVRVLVVAAWQTVNLGDVAHGPGVVRAIQRLYPTAEITLWALDIDNRERAMYADHLPGVTVVEGQLSRAGELPPAIAAAHEQADVLVHGSGPSVVAHAQLAALLRHAPKPYGFFGITVDPFGPQAVDLVRSAAMVEAVDGDLLDPTVRALLANADFIFCRDTLSQRFLATQGISATFGPDATVACDLVAPAAVETITGGTVGGDRPYVCVVPRLRFTPYHRIHHRRPTAEDARREAISAAHAGDDRSLLCAAIAAIVDHGHDVLVAPEMSYAVELARQWFGDMAVTGSSRVHVLDRFWSMPEASAVHRQAAAVVSMECHSPLLALAHGVPAVHLRQAHDSIKGQMYADLGLADRLVEATPQARDHLLTVVDRLLTDERCRERTRDARDAALEHTSTMATTVATVAAGTPHRADRPTTHDLITGAVKG